MAANSVKLCKKKSAVVLSYGLTSGDFHAESVEITPRGTRFQMVTPSGKIAMWSPLIGNVNVYNVLAASAAGYARDCPAEAIAKGIFDLASVPGRFERVDCGQPFTVVVDYAHTDDALRNLTALARDFVARAGLKGKVITLFGCGGDRDRAKRPLMGEAAGKGSDFVVLTSDNPRSEDPLAIMNDASLVCKNPDCRSRAQNIPWSPTAARPSLSLCNRQPPATSCCSRARDTKKCRSQKRERFRSTMWRSRARA